jgi:hypothetical protein
MDRKVRMLGVLPVAFFFLQAFHYHQIGHLDEILWFCHVANMGLGLGLLFAQEQLVRTALLWTLAGVLPWAGDFLATGILPSWTSILMHLGGGSVSLLALRNLRARGGFWIRSLMGFVAMQALCRWGTNPAFNVNLSHSVWGGWEKFFPFYLSYWAFIVGLTGLVLWGTERVCLLFFPQTGRK